MLKNRIPLSIHRNGNLNTLLPETQVFIILLLSASKFRAKSFPHSKAPSKAQSSSDAAVKRGAVWHITTSELRIFQILCHSTRYGRYFDAINLELDWCHKGCTLLLPTRPQCLHKHRYHYQRAVIYW